MTCAHCRDALSARADGELPAAEAEALNHHLAGCAACRWWEVAVDAVAHWSALATPEPAPDLSQSILRSLDDQADRRRAVAGRPAQVSANRPVPGGRRAAWLQSPLGVSRLGLVLVGLVQLCYAIPGLIGDDSGAPVHIAREQGSWGLALAFALLVAAWRPHLVDGLLPFVAALAVGLATTAALDIAAGNTSSIREVSHVAAIIGLGLLWSIHWMTCPGGTQRRRDRLSAPGTA
jgi:predicted anti-sigma-YlaC factor YlaD